MEDEIIDDINDIQDIDDLDNVDPSDIVVYARDWTVDTINKQILLGNIDLNPKFQRRNAWTDDRRSKLVESIIMGYPIPEIVLAEDPRKKKSFIVIDGKQRLLSIAGFIDNERFLYWTTPKLKNLSVRKELNGLSYNKLPENAQREFDNSSLRCTVITNFNNIQVLYDIFYRLNSGSVALSTQELRQALNKGPFGDYLVEVTNSMQLLHQVMGLSGPDRRLRDIEIILRLISFLKFPKNYQGNLKNFLDNQMKFFTDNWVKEQSEIINLYQNINETIDLLKNIFGDYKYIGRKYKGKSFESRFNKVLFEVEIYYFVQLNNEILDNKDKFVSQFKNLCETDSEFMDSIESSTKNIENYKIRYSKFKKIIDESFDLTLENPFA